MSWFLANWRLDSPDSPQEGRRLDRRSLSNWTQGLEPLVIDAASFLCRVTPCQGRTVIPHFGRCGIPHPHGHLAE